MPSYRSRVASKFLCIVTVLIMACSMRPSAQAETWFQVTPRYNGLSRAADGSLYAAGTFLTSSITVGGTTFSNYGGTARTEDAVIARHNEIGNVLWARQLGGAGADQMIDIATDAQGNAYALGAGSGTWIAPQLTMEGVTDAVLIKVDSSGGISWARRFGGPGATMTPKAVVTDAAGNIFVSGIFNGANLTAPAIERRGLQDIFVFKLDAAGNTIWARNFGGGGTTMDTSGLAVDSAGHVYLTGRFTGNNPSFPAIPANTGNYFALKVSGTGDIAWARTTSSTGQFFVASAVGVDGGGNVYVAGGGAGPLGGSNLWLWKLTAGGDTTWLNSYGGTQAANVTPVRIAAEQDGTIYVGATYNGTFATPSGALAAWGGAAFSYDSIVLKFDAAGTLNFGLNYGSRSEEQAPASTRLLGLTSDSRGSYYFSAYATGWGERPKLPNTGADYLAKYPTTAAADTPSPVPQTGWWYNPAQTGRGLAIEYYRASGRIFLGVFGYGPGGVATWQVGVCTYDAATRTCSGRLDTYENGATLTELTHATATPTAGAGPFTLNFADSRNGTVTWANEQFPISRFKPTTADGTDTTGNAVAYTGWYWDPNVAGRGYFLETWRNADGSVPLYGVGFMYRPDGTPTWYVLQGLATYLSVETRWGDLPFTEFAGGTPSFVGGNWTVPTQMQQVATFPFSMRWRAGAAMLLTGTSWSWMTHFVQ